MRIAKASGLALVGIVVVAIALLRSGKSRSSGPLTLTFLGYSPGSNGQQVASFCMSNSSSRPLMYLAEGPPLPCYYYTSLQFHDANTGWTGVTNYRTPFLVPATRAFLPPGSGVTFKVPMAAGTNGVKVGVHYVPPRGGLSRMAKKLEVSLTGRSEYENVELKAPFQ